ncbi:hypothetical protein, partial [Methylomonas fluvii]
ETLLDISKKCPASVGWIQGRISGRQRCLVDGEYFTNEGKSQTDSVYGL